MPPPPGLIGRKRELQLLERASSSRKSEFVIVYGRRRVGKTYLVDQKFGGQFTFRMTAIANATLEQQLANFYAALNMKAPHLAEGGIPANWFQAFQLVIRLASGDTADRKVLFFDELPWLDAPGSDFIQALEHFWNSWASLRNDILLIGCGSAASWMVNQLIRSKGGLHNRITERILLQPFNLSETEEFLRSRGAVYDRYQLAEFYMTMGGIPYYLENIQVNRSVHQNIDRMCFTPGAVLNVEYENLYRSLFNNYDRHLAVVETLARKSKGIDRKELLQASGLPDGGTSSNILEELEQSGFIKRYFPFGKTKRDAIYQLTDPYTLFYLTFVKDSKAEGPGAWISRLNSPKWRAWSGYAFEHLCFYHIGNIKRSLGISGVYTEISTWRSQKSEPGVQIDLLIDRADRIVNVCEIKFSATPFTITKAYAENLKNKLAVFREETGANKTLLLTMITAYGLKTNDYSIQLVGDSLDMGALFE